MKLFPNNETKAAAYAAMKELERMLKTDGELPPGFSYDASNVSVTITIPQGISVSRDNGKNGDGKQWKKATQNLYGFAILYECFRIARLFKHHKKLERVLLMIVRRAVKNSISSEDAFRELMPQRANDIRTLKDSLDIPKREEPTPRMVNRPDKPRLPTITIQKRKAA